MVATRQTFALIQLLTQLGDALRQGRLEIEDRRQRKAEETIREAREGAIETLREDYLTAQANVQETLRQLKTTGLLDKRNDIEQRQTVIRSEKEHLSSHTQEIRRRIESLTKTVAKQKESIEHQTKQVTGKDIEIRID
jgi:flagellar biosynthesis chaperone FliJ